MNPGTRTRTAQPAHLAPLVAVALLALACTPVPTATPLPVNSTPPATQAPTAAPSPPATALAPTPAPTLAAISTADFGEGTWKVIATETNDGGIPRTEVLSFVDNEFAFSFTCIGTGSATLTIGAHGGPMPTVPTSIDIVRTTFSCPDTEVFFDDTGQYNGGTQLISNVDPSPGVRYRLIIATRVS